MSDGRTHWEGCWRDHHDCAVAEVERLRADRERWDWFFGPLDKRDFLAEYMNGIGEKYTPDEWRAAVDRFRLSLPTDGSR